MRVVACSVTCFFFFVRLKDFFFFLWTLRYHSVVFSGRIEVSAIWILFSSFFDDCYHLASVRGHNVMVTIGRVWGGGASWILFFFGGFVVCFFFLAGNKDLTVAASLSSAGRCCSDWTVCMQEGESCDVVSYVISVLLIIMVCSYRSEFSKTGCGHKCGRDLYCSSGSRRRWRWEKTNKKWRIRVRSINAKRRQYVIYFVQGGFCCFSLKITRHEYFDMFFGLLFTREASRCRVKLVAKKTAGTTSCPRSNALLWWLLLWPSYYVASSRWRERESACDRLIRRK